MRNPKRILFLGERDAGVLGVVKDLAGSAPSPDESGSIAGLTHEVKLETAYYSAIIPVWIDEVTDLETWQAEFLKPEAKEVVDVVGAWVFCFRGERGEDVVNAKVQKALRSVQAVIEHHRQDYATEAVMLAVAIPVDRQSVVEKESQPSQEEEEEKCMEFGFEYIDYAATGKNEFGERVGLERLKEALEAAEWDAEGDDEDGLDIDDLDFDNDGGVDESNRDEAQMTAEIFGMKAALNGEDKFDAEAEDPVTTSGQEAQVEDLDRLMSKLLAVKEGSADLPEAQRRRLAAKAVRELLQSDRGI